MKKVCFSGLSSPALPSAALMPPSAAPEWLRVGCSLETTPTSTPYARGLDGGAHPGDARADHHHVVSNHQASGGSVDPSSSSSLPSRSRRTALLANRNLGYPGSGRASRGAAALFDRSREERLAKMAFALPAARRVHRDLSQAELHDADARDAEHPAHRLRRAQRPDARCWRARRRSTFIVSDDPDDEPHQAIDRDEWERVSALQDAYIAEQEMIVVDGYIGNDPEHRVPARLYIEAANANIAGMQDVLYFHDADEDGLRAGAGRHLHAQPRRRRATRTTA